MYRFHFTYPFHLLHSVSPHSIIIDLNIFPPPLPVLPVRNRLKADLHPEMFPSTAGKSNYSYLLSELWYFYELENPATSGVPNRLLRDTRTRILKKKKSETDVRGRPRWKGSITTYTSRGEFRRRQTRQLPRAVDLKGRLLSCQSY